MAYFVTGATGFIGRHLVERLLEREGTIHVLVRAGSTGRLDALIHRWDGSERIVPVVGDLGKPLLGLDPEQAAELRGTVDHFFHLAAVYDMTASEEQDRLANVEGTRHAVALANVVEAGCFHHASSIAVAGAYRGTFREDMFDEGQPLEHPYHRTKFEAERIAREETTVPWRVYRPSV
ncbi:MAG TPA: SDR family oxidoreductase, partial [Conexibacter sp.]|nr:SDR family oxidoreductase [Conexibacter sp.]